MSSEPIEEKIGLNKVDIAEISPYYFRPIKRDKKRINIILPSLNPEHVFGGIATALKFYETVAAKWGYDKRIIVVDALPSAVAMSIYDEEYTFVNACDDIEDAAQIVSYSGRSAYGIPVSQRDYFIFTGWWTAHCAQEAFAFWEKETGIRPNPFIYFIQDYEPGFYAWSSRYLLADATYKSKYKQIAIFNTKLLQEYFHNNQYSFYQEYAFEPVLNEQLKVKLYQLSSSVMKKKQILIYGRPSTDRNAFLLILEALKRWVHLQNEAREWRLLSVGEIHEPIALSNEVTLESAGKLSLDEYAAVLKESYAGISLMVSPHPSYPPLEMSVFGVKVITNTFANKDLQTFNDNIVSLSMASPDNIAQNLEQICNQYTPSVAHSITNQDYCERDDIWGFIGDIKNVLDNDEVVESEEE